MPAIVWAKSSKIGYLSRAWPAPTCCIYSLLSNYLVLKTLYVILAQNLYGILEVLIHHHYLQNLIFNLFIIKLAKLCTTQGFQK